MRIVQDQSAVRNTRVHLLLPRANALQDIIGIQRVLEQLSRWERRAELSIPALVYRPGSRQPEQLTLISLLYLEPLNEHQLHRLGRRLADLVRKCYREFTSPEPDLWIVMEPRIGEQRITDDLHPSAAYA